MSNMDLNTLILRARYGVFPIIKAQDGLYSRCDGLAVSNYNSAEGAVTLKIWKFDSIDPFTISGTFDKDDTDALDWIQENVETIIE